NAEQLAKFKAIRDQLPMLKAIVMIYGSDDDEGVYSWSQLPALAPVLAPVLALGSLPLLALDGPARAASPRAAGRSLVPAALVVVVATLLLAASLPALAWALPVHPTEGLRLVPLVQGLAEAVGERGGLTIFEVEGAIASALAAIVLGGAVAMARAGAAAARCLAPLAWPRRAGLVLAALAVAAALVVSRKTAGAAALMPGVIGLTFVLGGGLLRISGVAPRGRLGLVLHLAGVALALALLWLGARELPIHPFLTACLAVGALAVLAAGLTTAPGAAVAPDDPNRLERDGAGRL
ncbi:MAG: hypothetical protein KDK70_41150, partial [Myxococcales bacterium]|nr:hypothetical protein [Myxococcales bacterium]